MKLCGFERFASIAEAEGSVLFVWPAGASDVEAVVVAGVRECAVELFTAAAHEALLPLLASADGVPFPRSVCLAALFRECQAVHDGAGVLLSLLCESAQADEGGALH